MNGGHYTACSLEELDGVWWNQNDAFVSRVSDVSSLVSASAYLLVYRRQDMREVDIGKIFPVDASLGKRTDIEGVACKPWPHGGSNASLDEAVALAPKVQHALRHRRIGRHLVSCVVAAWTVLAFGA